jgi:circadian clock protein KaiB
MMSGDSDATLRRFEERVADLATRHYVLTLFVSGASEVSVRAIASVRSLCERHLAGRYDLEVVDVYRDVARATSRNVVAVPTLVRELPLPQRRLVGDMSDVSRVLGVLEITAVGPVTGRARHAGGTPDEGPGR